MSLFILCIWKGLPNKYRIIDLIFFFQYFKDVAPSSSVLHCFRWDVLILEMNCISLSVCSFYGFKYFDFGIYLGIVLFFFLPSCFFFLRFFEILGWWYSSFHQIWKIFSCYFFKYFSVTFSALGTPITHLLSWLKWCHSSWIKSSACLCFIFYPISFILYSFYFCCQVHCYFLYSIVSPYALYWLVGPFYDCVSLFHYLCHCCFCFKWWIPSHPTPPPALFWATFPYLHAY